MVDCLAACHRYIGQVSFLIPHLAARIELAVVAAGAGAPILLAPDKLQAKRSALLSHWSFILRGSEFD